MSRSQRKNSKECQKIGARFIELLETHLGLTLSQASKILGYANATTLSAIKKGRTLPDPGRLLFLASQLKDKAGRKVDIHWIFTGHREPFLEAASKTATTTQQVERLYQKLPSKKQRALLRLLE